MLKYPGLQAGRVAVITGAASGIGLATAERFLAMGMRVVLADVDAEQLGQVEQRLSREHAPERVLAIETDVAQLGQVQRLQQQVCAQWGPVAVLMNNAATEMGGGPWERYEEFRAVLGVNLLGAVHGIQAFLPSMIEQNEPGLVIFTGSKQGITCPPGNTAYNVSKAGLKVLSESVEHQLRNTANCAIRAHLLIPGWTHTEIARKAQRDRARLQGDAEATLPPPTAKPAGAWTAEQVVDELLVGIGERRFYILCPDNEVSEQMDRKRIAWAAGDLIEGRPPLSRWHSDYREAFERDAAGET